MSHNVISVATVRNWERLGVNNAQGKLVSRANKTRSQKHIFPSELIRFPHNSDIIDALVQVIFDNEIPIGDAMYTLGISLLARRGYIEISDPSSDSFSASRNPHLASFLTRQPYRMISALLLENIPDDEYDVLGIIYQYLLTEGEKNSRGSYYTPVQVIDDMVADIILTPTSTVLDPCCGSLMFLLRIPGIAPEHIYALDNDPIAVMIATINYFIYFPLAESPRIYCADYLRTSFSATTSLPIAQVDNDDAPDNSLKFDYIVTNPPWGAVNSTLLQSRKLSVVSSREIFSYFLIRSHHFLSHQGQLRFLLPAAILNVRKHQDIRRYLLENSNIFSIRCYAPLFSGVSTKYVGIYTHKTGYDPYIWIKDGQREWLIEKSRYVRDYQYTFRLTTQEDENIIEHVLRQKAFDLRDSTWALGIVTGNNRKKLSNVYHEGSEPIYTGKEIMAYRLKSPTYYIQYDRKSLQQVASDDIYRSTPKLVYKFISQKLTFAIDQKGSLFLNSANILIPHIPNTSLYTVCALLNSQLYQYLYRKIFNEIKILKSNLMMLPFPDICRRDDTMISAMVADLVSDGVSVGMDTCCDDHDYMSSYISRHQMLQQIIYDLFGIKKQWIEYIEGQTSSSEKGIY